MSLSCPDGSGSSRQKLWGIGARLFASVATVVVAAPSLAAQLSVQPIASVTAETDSNLDLIPASQDSHRQTEGYSADLATILAITTPNSGTTLEPQFDYRDYPQDTGDDRLEGRLDFNSGYRSSRSTARIFGSLDHQDEFNAELPSALYNDVNPLQPTAPETGTAVVGGTRDSVLLLPDYAYKLTPLMSAGASVIYQSINYSPSNDINLVDFDYYLGKGFLSWALSQRTALSFGGYGSKYQAKHIDSHATAGGGSLDLDSNWTPLLSTTVSVIYQRTNVEMTVPTTVNSEANAWGATVAVTYKSALSQFRLNGGRLITPSGGGALYVADQLRFEYDRDINQRLALTAAFYGTRDRGLTANVVGDNRDYVQPLVELKWMMTRTWFLLGGFQYQWQKYQFYPDGALSTRLYVSVGYKGLGVQYQ